jgi:hypothetical protein
MTVPVRKPRSKSHRIEESLNNSEWWTYTVHKMNTAQLSSYPCKIRHKNMYIKNKKWLAFLLHIIEAPGSNLALDKSIVLTRDLMLFLSLSDQMS